MSGWTDAVLDIFEEIVAGCHKRQDARRLAKAGSIRALVSHQQIPPASAIPALCCIIGRLKGLAWTVCR